MSEPYNEADDGEWITPVHKGHRLQCCDCGLVHTVDFRVLPPSSEHPHGAIQYRMRRNKRATAQVHRHMKKGAR